MTFDHKYILYDNFIRKITNSPTNENTEGIHSTCSVIIVILIN